MEIKVSDKFTKKLLKSIFEPVDQSSWYKTTVNWLTDSKYRTYTRLDSFLQEQIDNPNTELLEEAQKYMVMVIILVNNLRNLNNVSRRVY